MRIIVGCSLSRGNAGIYSSFTFQLAFPQTQLQEFKEE